MYDAEVLVIDQLKAELKREAPHAFHYLERETAGASTGLEYYGMLQVALENALRSGLIPQQSCDAIEAAAAAIGRMYRA